MFYLFIYFRREKEKGFDFACRNPHSKRSFRSETRTSASTQRAEESSRNRSEGGIGSLPRDDDEWVVSGEQRKPLITRAIKRYEQKLSPCASHFERAQGL